MLDLYMMCVDLKNSQSVLRQKSNVIILDIYKKLNDPTDKTVKIVEGWKREFRYVYGDVEANLSRFFLKKILCLNKHKYCFILFKHILVY